VRIAISISCVSVLTRDKNGPPEALFDPHLETRKDIATKREKLRPGHSSIIVQNFMPIGGTVAEVADKTDSVWSNPGYAYYSL